MNAEQIRLFSYLPPGELGEALEEFDRVTDELTKAQGEAATLKDYLKSLALDLDAVTTTIKRLTREAREKCDRGEAPEEETWSLKTLTPA